MALHIGLGGWASEHVRVDESQVLALLFGESVSAEAASGARFLIHLSIRPALPQGGRDECTLSGRIEPSRTL